MGAVTDSLGRIPRLYHFTDVKNLPQIKEAGGLFSTAKLRELEISHYPGGDELSLDLDVKSGMDQYVHLCFTARHPMAYRIKERNSEAELCYLKINRAILYQEGVRFSTGVAYAQGVETVSIEEACKDTLIDYDVLYSWTDWRDPHVQARRQAAEKYEILVPHYVPIDFIMDFPNG